MKKILILILLFAAIKSEAQTSLYDKDTLAVNPVFRQRVKSAGIIAANNLAADTTQAAYLLSYCNQIITNPDGGWISALTYQVVSNPAITYNSTDNDIQFTVNSNMDKCARAYGNILPTPPELSSFNHSGMMYKMIGFWSDKSIVDNSLLYQPYTIIR